MRSENDDLRLLQALCQASDAGLVRRACLALRAHPWSCGEHGVVYEACAELVSRGARIAPLALAAQLTRAGFPDADLDALFAPIPAPDRRLSRFLDTVIPESRP
jgi:hypothetical protein